MSRSAAAKPLSPAWFEERRSYIGASDAAIIIGVSPYSTPYELWLEKTGQAEAQADNPVLRFGRRVEDAIAAEYSDMTGRKLERFHRVQRHPLYPFIACNPDRRVVGERGLVQVKSSWSGWSEVPEHVEIQCLVELACTRLDFVDIALGTAFAKVARHTVPRDDLRIHQIITILRAWWQRHMVEGIEPERTGRYIRDLRGEDVMTAASEQQLEAAHIYADLGERIGQLEARRSNVKEFIQRSMAGAKALRDKANGLSVTWTPWSKPASETNWEAVASAYRLLLRAQVEDVEIPPELLSIGGYMQLRPEFLDAIESLHTREFTKSGESWRVTWKDQPPTAGEEE